MRIYTVLRLLLSGFFLYFSWAFIPFAFSPIEKLFWGSWLFFLYLIVGGNLAAFLKLCEPPALEQTDEPLHTIQNR